VETPACRVPQAAIRFSLLVARASEFPGDFLDPTQLPGHDGAVQLFGGNGKSFRLDV